MLSSWRACKLTRSTKKDKKIERAPRSTQIPRQSSFWEIVS